MRGGVMNKTYCDLCGKPILKGKGVPRCSFAYIAELHNFTDLHFVCYGKSIKRIIKTLQELKQEMKE